MSQLTLYDTNATNVLSTQINYDPLVLSMTQYEDRKNMIIANSITQNNNILIETNSFLCSCYRMKLYSNKSNYLKEP